ncbi:reticulon-like protein B22 [Ipomoea triloba]|uniref:reticulon-like protein B22 n=1 Tax=Ipomoea triloba TaxID=35885 RepID=UPI00125E8D57|nr:reticulon-like protein B22 [Ipomoea triloba]
MEDNGDGNSTGATAVTAGGNGRNGNSNSSAEAAEARKRVRLGCSGGGGIGKPVIVMICGSLVYYHCAYQKSSFVSLVSDVFIVLLCSLAILGLLFRQMNIPVPVDPLEWQICQDTANTAFACLANTIGAAESVLRVAATGHDKRLFFKVVAALYMLSVLGRAVPGITLAYAGLCLFCLYMLAENSQLISSCASRIYQTRDCSTVQDNS